jgi:hypothetical protein
MCVARQHGQEIFLRSHRNIQDSIDVEPVFRLDIGVLEVVDVPQYRFERDLVIFV